MLLLTGMSPAAKAQAPDSSAKADGSPLRIRVAFSKSAQKRLHQRRLRRLLAIELDRIAPLDAGAVGPLDDKIIRVWIDVPTERRALIEVRRSHRSRARRTLNITGYPSDAAARLVAIATSEMVRVQALPKKERHPLRGGAQTGNDEHRDSAQSGFRLGSSAGTLLVPKSDPRMLFASELLLEHGAGPTSIGVYGRWAAAPEPQLRWYELGGSIGGRLPLGTSDWRFHAAIRGGAVSIAVPNAVRIDHHPATSSRWIGRAGGQLGVERALGPAAWLGLAIEPGATLGVLHVEDNAGAERNIGGFTLGLNVTLIAEPHRKR